MKKTWPIHNASACQYKWAWSTIFLADEQTSSCHRVGGFDMKGLEFKDFHNHPGKIKDRELMIKGEWPNNACHYCKRIEDAGGISERTGYINSSDLVPLEFDTADSGEYPTHVTPRILEIYFNNVCNQSCVYCNPMFSSVIAQEIKKFGPISNRYNLDGTWKENANYTRLKGELWKWMHENSMHLYDFHILGGEPMFQPEFNECLDFFEATSNPKLNWKIFSNLKHNTEQLKKKLERIVTLVRTNKLRRFEVVCSIDCWDKEAEYARNGMDLTNWEENFNLLLSYPEISISVHSTLTPITLPTAWKLAEKVIEWRKIKPIDHGWNTIADPQFLDPSVFGHYLTEYMNKLLVSVGDQRPSYLDGFAIQISSAKIKPKLMLELRDYLDELDRRRDQNWRAIYPWMDAIFIKELDTKNNE